MSKVKDVYLVELYKLYCILLKFATNVKAKKLVANQQLESFFSTFSLRRRNALNVGADFNVGNDGRTTSEKNDIAGKMRS